MKIIEKYRASLIAGVLLLVLVGVKLTGGNYFKNSADNTLTSVTALAPVIKDSENKADMPVADIRSSVKFTAGHTEGAVNIPMEQLLTKENRRFFRNNKNGIILYSDDLQSVTRAWAILDQLNYKNIYISAPGLESDEVLKYKIHADLVVAPR